MQFKHAPAEFVLKENHPLAAVHARGVCIRCTEGRIWITVSGQAEDIFLDAGESWICEGDGLLLIDALDRAQVKKHQLMSAFRRQFAWLGQAGRLYWPGTAGRRSRPA